MRTFKRELTSRWTCVGHLLVRWAIRLSRGRRSACSRRVTASAAIAALFATFLVAGPVQLAGAAVGDLVHESVAGVPDTIVGTYNGGGWSITVYDLTACHRLNSFPLTAILSVFRDEELNN